MGNSADFGDLVTAVSNIGAASNPIRGILLLVESPSALKDIDFVTIATTGNATRFW